MPWSSMNIDILARIEPAYTLSFAKSPLVRFGYDRELYLEEGEKCLNQDTITEKEMWAYHIWI